MENKIKSDKSLQEMLTLLLNTILDTIKSFIIKKGYKIWQNSFKRKQKGHKSYRNMIKK